MDEQHRHSDNNRFVLPGKAILIGFIAIAGFFLLTEHRAHLYGYFPFILLALCPLLHMFHGGHGDHGDTSPREGRSDQKPHSH